MWNEIVESLNRYWIIFLNALPRFAIAIIVLILTWLIVTKISNIVKARLTGKAHDPLFGTFISKVIKYALLVCCIILFLHLIGLSGIAGGLLAGAGISAFIIGFAFKDIAENFLAGFILAFDRPFSLNDTVKIGDHTGHIVALNFRTTQIKTFDEKDVFIPNSKIIKDTLTNLTKDGMLRLDFLVGIAYEDDISAALQLISKTTEEVPDILNEKKPFTVVEEMATSTVNIRVFFWTKTDDYKKGVLLIKSKVIQNVKEALVENGFTLPADIQELKLYDKRSSFPVELINNSK